LLPSDRLSEGAVFAVRDFKGGTVGQGGTVGEAS
jgi:hypothetical protein